MTSYPNAITRGFFVLAILLLTAVPGLAPPARSADPGATGDVPISPPLDDLVADQAAYDHMRLADPALGEIPPDMRRRELAHARGLAAWRQSAMHAAAGVDPAAKLNGWHHRGPWDRGGRTRALAYDVSDPTHQTLLAASAGGGVWRSTDGGASWTKTTAPDQTQCMTTLAQDTRAGRQDVWYAGSGELVINTYSANGDPIRGDGLCKSTDGGQTWTPLAATSGTSGAAFTNPWQYVWRVATDPSNLVEDEVYAAIVGSIRRSVDGGETWQTVLGVDDPAVSHADFTDVIVTSSGVVYAALSDDGVVAGIFRSPDGLTWTDITPAGLASYGRIVLAAAPSVEWTVYAAVDNAIGLNEGFFVYHYLSGSGDPDLAEGIWSDRSINLLNIPRPGGGTANVNFFESGHSMSLTVDPLDWQVVYLGSIYLHRSNNGFATNDQITAIGGANYPGHGFYVHSLTFEPGSTTTAVTGTDGGLHRTANVNGTPIWESLDNGYTTNMLYTAAIDEGLAGSRAVVAGSWGDGCLFNNDLTEGSRWYSKTSDIGVWCEVGSAADPVGTYLMSAGRGAAYVMAINNATGQAVYWRRITPTNASGYLFVNPVIFDPADINRVYLGTWDGVWRNNDVSAIPTGVNSSTMINWDHLTTEPASDAISALAMPRSGADVLYYGTVYGRVFRVEGASTATPGVAPTELDLGPDFPVHDPQDYLFISSISISPANDQDILISVSNYGVASLFHTADGGATWTSVEGNLGGPDGPAVHDTAILPVGALYPPENPFGGTVFFAATSTGLYSTLALVGDQTVWRLEAPDQIGNAPTRSVVARPSDGEVVVGTHGMGIFRINFLESVVDAIDSELPAAGHLAQNVPNPFNPRTVIRFELPRPAAVRLRVYDTSGRLVRTLVDGRRYDAGRQECAWAGRDDAGRAVASGTYLYRLEADGFVETRRMVLLR